MNPNPTVHGWVMHIKLHAQRLACCVPVCWQRQQTGLSAYMLTHRLHKGMQASAALAWASSRSACPVPGAPWPTSHSGCCGCSLQQAKGQSEVHRALAVPMSALQCDMQIAPDLPAALLERVSADAEQTRMAANVQPASCHTPGPLVQLTNGDSLALAHSLQRTAVALRGKVGQPMLLRPLLPHMVRCLEGHTPACQPATSVADSKAVTQAQVRVEACMLLQRPASTQTGLAHSRLATVQGSAGSGMPEQMTAAAQVSLSGPHAASAAFCACVSSQRAALNPHRSCYATLSGALPSPLSNTGLLLLNNSWQTVAQHNLAAASGPLQAGGTMRAQEQEAALRRQPQRRLHASLLADRANLEGQA